MSVEDAIRNLHIHQKCIFPVVKGEVEVCEDNVNILIKHNSKERREIGFSIKVLWQSEACIGHTGKPLSSISSMICLILEIIQFETSPVRIGK